tara:strand:- start:1430 stop:1615 length:186 start_codon:yes stop_codon:yes gene_type:complete
MSNKKEVLSFEDWFKKEHNNLIDLFCSFIKESKVYDVTLDQFTQFLYQQTLNYKKGDHIYD